MVLFSSSPVRRSSDFARSASYSRIAADMSFLGPLSASDASHANSGTVKTAASRQLSAILAYRFMRVLPSPFLFRSDILCLL